MLKLLAKQHCKYYSFCVDISGMSSKGQTNGLLQHLLFSDRDLPGKHLNLPLLCPPFLTSLRIIQYITCTRNSISALPEEPDLLKESMSKALKQATEHKQQDLEGWATALRFSSSFPLPLLLLSSPYTVVL